jgi:SAM-dependent methyltransferase
VKYIEYRGRFYPELQTRGNAAKFARPFFDEIVPAGARGYDVGCNRREWAIRPDAELVDPGMDPEYHALNLPAIPGGADYIFSSHALEHVLGSWQRVLDYWLRIIKPAGIVFLYLPNMDEQKYWAFGNEKHIHYLTPEILRGYCEHKGNRYYVTPGCDLNSSFYCLISGR